MGRHMRWIKSGIKIHAAVVACLVVAGCTATQSVNQPSQVQQTATDERGPTTGARPGEACYPIEYRRLRVQTKFSVVVKVNPDGKGTIHQFPNDISDQWRDAAECVIAKQTFNPARRDGQPVVGFISVPITFALN